ILTGAWLVAALTSFGFEGILAHEVDITGPEGRRRRTQLTVIHRLTLVTIGALAVGVALFAFPAMRVVGTSPLASARIACTVAGHTSLGFGRLRAHEVVMAGPDGRRRRTQVTAFRRLTLVTIGVLAVGVALFTCPAMRVGGTSLLASAGIASIVAGLAAQSIL